MSSPDLSGSPFETLDPRFDAITHHAVKLERLGTGCRWAEGPAYFPAGRYLVWSDIPNDRMLRWDETTATSGFRHPRDTPTAHRRSPGPAGQLRAPRTPGHPDRDDGTITVLADRYEGKRLN